MNIEAWDGAVCELDAMVRSNRTLAFAPGSPAYREQAQLLKLEGVRFDGEKVVEIDIEDSLDRLLWGPQD